jgi:exopolysaccharide biosynthesis polyprenyl glycosylphosphotransferase
MPLPPYDIRVRRELAHRRTLLAMLRHLQRIVLLHVLDAGAATGAGFVALRILPIPANHSILPLLVGFVLVGLDGRRAYQPAHGRRDPARILSGVLLGFVAASLVSILPPLYDLPLAFVTLFAVLAAAAILFERTLVDFLVRQMYAHGVGLRRAIIVARASDADSIVDALRVEVQDHFVVGFVTPAAVADASALGTLVDLEAVIRKEEPAELILGTQLPSEAFSRVADICLRNGVSILALPQWTKSGRGWVEPIRIGGIAGFWIHPVRLEVPSLLVKRAADIVLTSVLAFISLPLFVLIAIAIKIDSRGPIFFRQRRVGLGGREFTMWKFRSMEDRSETLSQDLEHLNPYPDSRLFKVASDPRVTSVGRWLRRFSLDELPQFFNVLAGDMSLVGPRPPLPVEVGRYDQHHFVRLTVVPGITGPWQVGGRNLITDFEEVVQLERDYIENWSFRLDLEIMAKTIGVMLSGRGAY